MSTLERAIEIAARAHAGQTDQGGAPYILHPLRLMLSVQGEADRMAAVLHDVIEDTPLTAVDLRREGFSTEVVDAVIALTKLKGEKRLDAARRLAPNQVARRVKLADLRDNMDLTRLGRTPTEKDLMRLQEYQQVKALLEAYRPEPGH